MAYSDFDIETVEKRLGITVESGNVFGALTPVPPPVWLVETLERNRRHAAFNNEKSRSEFIVVPILTAAGELVGGPISLFSGQRLDVDPQRGLVGACDYIIARTSPVPRLKAPLLTLVEAKKADIDLGLGQCIAQMIAADLFNKDSGLTTVTIYGCVTSGREWKFLRLDPNQVTLDTEDFMGSDLENLLAALVRTLQ